MSYEDFSQQTRSRKYVLAHIESKRSYKIFEPIGSDVYKKTVESFVVSVLVDGVLLTKASSESVVAGEWFYNSITGYVVLKLSDSSDPKIHRVYFTHRLFFSNIPINALSDISSGELVEYDARITDTDGLKLELDFEQTGIALTSTSSITLVSSDGYFIDKFDTNIFENGACRIYSTGDNVDFSEIKMIYRGLITSKSFSNTSVKFNLNDDISKLDAPIGVGEYSELDGDVAEAALGKKKRIIIGQVDSLQTVGLDSVFDGYSCVGTISGNADLNLLAGKVAGLAGQNVINGTGTTFLSSLIIGDKVKIKFGLAEYTYTVATIPSNIQITISGTLSAPFNDAEIRNLSVLNNVITGSGTLFLKEIVQDDIVKVIINGEESDFSVDKIISDTELRTSNEITTSFTGLIFKNKPEVNYRFKNRKWNIAGHRLAEFDVNITEIIAADTVKVDTTFDIFVGDFLKVKNFYYTAFEIFNNQIRFSQGLREPIIAGDLVSKVPVISAYNGRDKLVIERDFTFINTISGCDLIISDLAEFNTSKQSTTTTQLVFTIGSRSVTTPSTTADLTNIFKPRDFIKGSSINITDWFEISEVTQTEIKIVEAATYNFSGTVNYRSPSYIGDESIITVDCLGYYSDRWIKYPSDAVKFILENIGITELNNDSFLDAKDSCEMTMSLVYPESFTNSSKTAKQLITDINKSVFGSLFLDNDFNFAYKILNADIPEGVEYINDSDINNYSVTSKSDIYNSIALSYAPYNSKDDGSIIYKIIISSSEFVDEAVQKSRLLETKSFLYKEEDALVIAERWLLFKSLTQSVIKLTSPISLIGKTLNDVLIVDFDRMYQRYGNSSSRKIGIINSISKDFDSVSIQINDLGNIFTRIGKIAPDDIDDYLTAGDDVDKCGFITDNETETPNPLSEDDLGCNLIG